VADCEQRFVEVAVSESHFESIQAGDIARVQLKGGEQMLRAPVIAVRGAGARNEHPNLAARVPRAERGQLRVLVSLEGVGLDRAASNFCHIGRTAEVYFSRGTTGAIEAAAEAVGGWATALWRRIDAQVDRLALQTTPSPGDPKPPDKGHAEASSADPGRSEAEHASADQADPAVDAEELWHPWRRAREGTPSLFEADAESAQAAGPPAATRREGG
jgi:hypothetical protein